MSALTAPRSTPEIAGRDVELPVLANEVIYPGAMVSLDANNYAVAATATNTERPIGRAAAAADATNLASGAITVRVQYGVFGYVNDGTTPCVIGGNAYVLDDQTVSGDDDTGARPLAGVVKDIKDGLVYVAMR